MNILKNDRNIHTRRPDILWIEKRKEPGNNYSCSHKECSVYATWKSRHPTVHRELVKEADNCILAVYESIHVMLTSAEPQVEINGTIRSKIPPCVGSVKSDGSHPFTCRNCYKHLEYLKMKVSKKKSASYSIEENRCGKRGMCHKYLTDSEMRSFTASCIEDNKQMKKALHKISILRSTTSWTSRLLKASDEDEEEKFINDLTYALQTEKLTTNSVQFKLMSNLVNKLICDRNHKYSSPCIVRLPLLQA